MTQPRVQWQVKTPDQTKTLLTNLELAVPEGQRCSVTQLENLFDFDWRTHLLFCCCVV